MSELSNASLMSASFASNFFLKIKSKLLVRRYKVFIFIAFIGIFYNGGINAQSSDSLLVEGTFRFYFQKTDSILVDALIEKIQPSLLELEAFFKGKKHEEIKIILAKSKSEYFRQARVRIPEWSQAIAFTGEGKIILNLSTAEAIQKSPSILIHELWHIFLRLFYPSARVPVWINEGMAQYFERETLGFEAKRELATAISTGRLIDLAALDTVLNFGPSRARLGYIEALSATRFFIDSHGLGAVRLLLEEFQQGKDPDQAFLSVVGYDFIDFEIAWNAYLAEHYEWLVILNFDNLLWLSIGLLFIMALVLKKLRTRKTMQTWENEEDDEEYEGNDDWKEESRGF